jgi:DnaJ-class molecular chaperone
MAKNYYIVLRVSRAESPRGIQDAFRELAKKYHPDRIGPQGTRTFQEILEAYQALSDTEKRKLHNQELYKAETQEEIRPEPIRVRRPRAEPLVREPMSILRDFQTIRPGYEPLFDRIFRNFTGVGIPKGELPEGLNLELNFHLMRPSQV